MYYTIKKKDGEMRCIKTENWYVVLTLIGDGTKPIFQAQYYEQGLTKLQFKVLEDYSLSDVEEPECEEGKTKLKESEKEIIIYKMKEFFQMFSLLDRLEQMEKELDKMK